MKEAEKVGRAITAWLAPLATAPEVAHLTLSVQASQRFRPMFIFELFLLLCCCPVLLLSANPNAGEFGYLKYTPHTPYWTYTVRLIGAGGTELTSHGFEVRSVAGCDAVTNALIAIAGHAGLVLFDGTSDTTWFGGRALFAPPHRDAASATVLAQHEVEVRATPEGVVLTVSKPVSLMLDLAAFTLLFCLAPILVFFEKGRSSLSHAGRAFTRREPSQLSIELNAAGISQRFARYGGESVTWQLAASDILTLSTRGADLVVHGHDETHHVGFFDSPEVAAAARAVLFDAALGLSPGGPSFTRCVACAVPYDYDQGTCPSCGAPAPEDQLPESGGGPSHGPT